MSITEKAAIHHYKNLDYQDIEGELWKELPNYDGYFLISNFGRIKSLDRTIETSNGKYLHYKGRIYKGVVIKYKNKTIGDNIEEIKVGIFYCCKYQNIRIARMVYNLFVTELDFKTDGWVVAHKDGNRFNNQVSNLYLETVSQKQKKILQSGRTLKLSTFQTKEGKIKAAIARHKPITKFTLEGFPIKTYNSILEAANEIGISSSSIIKATKHITMVSAGGYLWQYGIIKNKIDTNFYKNFLKNSNLVQSIAVAQLSIDLLIFNCYKSINEASKKTGLHPNKISNAIKQKQLIGNFSWQVCSGVANW